MPGVIFKLNAIAKLVQSALINEQLSVSIPEPEQINITLPEPEQLDVTI